MTVRSYCLLEKHVLLDFLKKDFLLERAKVDIDHQLLLPSYIEDPLACHGFCFVDHMYSLLKYLPLIGVFVCGNR